MNTIRNDYQPCPFCGGPALSDNCPTAERVRCASDKCPGSIYAHRPEHWNQRPMPNPETGAKAREWWLVVHHTYGTSIHKSYENAHRIADGMPQWEIVHVREVKESQ